MLYRRTSLFIHSMYQYNSLHLLIPNSHPPLITFKTSYIYLFKVVLAALISVDVCRLPLVAKSGGYSLVVVIRLLHAGASLVEHMPQGTRTQ